METQGTESKKLEHLSALVLKVLSCAQVVKIDEMLDELGPFGELRLIKKKGHLRFVEKVESFDFVEDN